MIKHRILKEHTITWNMSKHQSSRILIRWYVTQCNSCETFEDFGSSHANAHVIPWPWNMAEVQCGSFRGPAGFRLFARHLAHPKLLPEHSWEIMIPNWPNWPNWPSHEWDVETSRKALLMLGSIWVHWVILSVVRWGCSDEQLDQTWRIYPAKSGSTTERAGVRTFGVYTCRYNPPPGGCKKTRSKVYIGQSRIEAIIFPYLAMNCLLVLSREWGNDP